MFKFVWLVIMSGCASCVSTELQCEQTKYLVGDCARLTEASVAARSLDQQKIWKDVVFEVVGRFQTNYIIVARHPEKGSLNPVLAATEEFNARTVPATCLVPKEDPGI